TTETRKRGNAETRTLWRRDTKARKHGNAEARKHGNQQEGKQIGDFRISVLPCFCGPDEEHSRRPCVKLSDLHVTRRQNMNRQISQPRLTCVGNSALPCFLGSESLRQRTCSALPCFRVSVYRTGRSFARISAMRNREVIRQWNLLRTLDARRHGATVAELARELSVTTRTIWRDLAALQEVGFPLTSMTDG